MNLDLNVFSSSNETRYISGAVAGGGFSITAFSSGFNTESASSGNDAFETEGTFDNNTFSSTSTTRYEPSAQEEVGAFDYTLDFTFE